MAETRKSQTGAGNVSGWTPGTATASTLFPGQITQGQAGLANTSASFGAQNAAPLPAGALTIPGVSGTSPLTSRVSSGWTAGRIAPASGPGQNFGVGTLADPRLASRSATGQPVNTGNVITSSAYRSPGVPDFFAGAVNDLNSGATAKAAMQAEWLSRLANSMGNAGDDAYLWAEVLRANGGLNPSGTGGGGPSFGAAITPGAIARGQGFLLTSQAAEINKRNALSGASAARTSMNWELQRQINSTMGNMAGSPIGTQPYVSQLFQQQAEKANNEYAAEALTRSAASLQPNQAALANRVIMPPNYGAPNGLINGTGYAIPYVSHPSGWAW